MTTKSSQSWVRSFGVSILLTLLLLATVGVVSGGTAIFLFVVLFVLEVTFSFDNAVVNAKLLVQLSPKWQMLFLTVGIIIAVFVVRFILPIFIVYLTTTDISFWGVGLMALENPEEYGRKLHEAGPMIDSFGGTFLLMIGMAFFFDNKKKEHWFPFEKTLAKVGQLDNVGIGIMLSVATTMYFTVAPANQEAVFVASVMGILLHVALKVLDEVLESNIETPDEIEDEQGNVHIDRSSITQKVGKAAFGIFIYLEVLDATFSFDGVIGAFAITNDVLLIATGLLAGAFFVRSMTIHLVRNDTLGKFKYLEHGAYWAILALGCVMIAKLYGVHPPEVVTGSLGLAFIAASVWWSKRDAKKDQQSELVGV